MNNVSLVGRMARDPEVRYSAGENATATCRFSVAVRRKFKNAEGNYDTDFISCVAFKQTAEIIAKYFPKGSLIGIQGNIRTGNYTNRDGQKVYTTDVYVDSIEFVGGKSENNSASATQTTRTNSAPERNDSFMNVPADMDEELPF